jgi:hypothetical protein
MRLIFAILLLSLASGIVGCGATNADRPSSSHNGTMIPLPGNKGFFEIKTTAAGKGDRSSHAKIAKNTITIFFYQPDGTSAMSPAPTDVKVKFGTGSDSPVVPLEPQAKAGDGSGFASQPGFYPSGFRGQLEAKINGEPVEATFVVR